MTLLHTVLIANRGEIAVRVARACKDAGLTSVAVYADPDRDLPHVRLADQAYALGGDNATDTYLNVEKIIATAKEAGANGIHPGYGFLSENADFAQAVIDADLIWIEPSPQAIRNLGDKVTARKIAERSGAPLVPGTKDCGEPGCGGGSARRRPRRAPRRARTRPRPQDLLRHALDGTPAPGFLRPAGPCASHQGRTRLFDDVVGTGVFLVAAAVDPGAVLSPEQWAFREARRRAGAAPAARRALWSRG